MPGDGPLYPLNKPRQEYYPLKLNQLKSNGTTSLELLLPDGSDTPTGVILTGITPDSKEWRQIQRDVFGKKNKAELIIEKKQQKIEIDPNDVERRQKVLAKSVIAIVGIDDLTLKQDEIADFLLDDAHVWMLDQWSAHLDERANFFGKAGKPASSGSKS